MNCGPRYPAAIIYRVHDTLLGGFSPKDFLRRFWQKRPLLIRSALPDFNGLLDQRRLFELAQRDDCESRLIIRDGRHWQVEHGPLKANAVRSLPPRGWTLLVQGVDHFLPAARDLLAAFDFVPHARLDDLMVSYAPPGGGVGPHIDSYDVFLLQGPGRRLWRVGRQRDLALKEDLPLKILKRFRPQGQAILSPGDMLYLPPGYAHEGIAQSACFTYSIGFRSPRYEELKTQFLAYLDETIRLEGIYADPDLRPQRHPGLIDDRMIMRVADRLQRIRWDRKMVRNFLGGYLTEPKGHVRFQSPDSGLDLASFVRAAQKRGLQLAPTSLLLINGNTAFINGESHRIASADRRTLLDFADERRLAHSSLSWSGPTQAMLYHWYCNGYLQLN